MKIELIATTKLGYKAEKEEFDNFGGKSAGICYMAHDFSTLLSEPAEKTARRIAQTKGSGHHSVYDHQYLSLYIEGLPKALAMVLNNEKMYTTSEKSARYTKMVLTADEQKLYNKWLGTFEELISDKYKALRPEFFTDSKIKKLAQENARYLTSVFTPTSMEYTISYRQLNYLYKFLRDQQASKQKNKFMELLSPAIADFCTAIETSVPYLDSDLQMDGKNRKISLFRDSILPAEKHFGSTYSTYYKGSFAELAQAQRHRTINYDITLLDTNEYYVPPILAENPTLVEEWTKDIDSLSVNFPQGMLVNINESGTLPDLILKAKERCCTFAQKEINDQTHQTLVEYEQALRAKGTAEYDALADYVQKYTKGSRCTFPDYTCLSRCGFPEGVTGEREI